MRHLISGEDWAMAGEDTVPTAAAPAAEPFKKSRRFIKSLLVGRLSHAGAFLSARRFPRSPNTLWRRFNTEVRPTKTRPRHDCPRLNESRIGPENRLTPRR